MKGTRKEACGTRHPVWLKSISGLTIVLAYLFFGLLCCCCVGGSFALVDTCVCGCYGAARVSKPTQHMISAQPGTTKAYCIPLCARTRQRQKERDYRLPCSHPIALFPTRPTRPGPFLNKHEHGGRIYLQQKVNGSYYTVSRRFPRSEIFNTHIRRVAQQQHISVN